MDESIWHKCNPPLIPKRTVNGGWTFELGQIWRRRINGKWQYTQDPQTFEEWADSQW